MTLVCTIFFMAEKNLVWKFPDKDWWTNGEDTLETWSEHNDLDMMSSLTHCAHLVPA